MSNVADDPNYQAGVRREIRKMIQEKGIKDPEGKAEQQAMNHAIAWRRTIDGIFAEYERNTKNAQKN